ncbi:hypothetical protein BJ138DRAFT_1117453 [Hygrophoropsis aurantiaca]|uniref:Uncharacterized protein n=1 Tax=Hygrophoropsis aurantiaca TaxID=72124 RepID=A0ACB8A0C4_9AGAM|nr:hypothetical protein BJ138DRAFT_1117453 [Hygrophoropsis aurantiaca]
MLLKGLIAITFFLTIFANAASVSRRSEQSYRFDLQIWNNYSYEGSLSLNWAQTLKASRANGAHVCEDFQFMNDKLRSYRFDPYDDPKSMELQFYENIGCGGRVFLHTTGPTSNPDVEKHYPKALKSSSFKLIHHGNGAGV